MVTALRSADADSAPPGSGNRAGSGLDLQPRHAPLSLGRQRRRLELAITFIVFLVGLLVMVVIGVPSLQQLESRTEEAGIANASFWASAVAAELNRYEDLAGQVASRSELAALLQEYLQGEVDFDRLRDFSVPRLGDAVERADDLAAVVRYDPDGRELLRAGPLAATLPATIELEPALDVAMLPRAPAAVPELFVLASAPIHGDDGEVLGHDQLIFIPDALERVLAMVERTSRTRPLVCLIHHDHAKRVAPGSDGRGFELTGVGGCLDGLDLEQIVAGETVRYMRRDEYGYRYVYHYQQLPGLDWAVNIRSPAERYYEELVSLLAGVLAGLALLAAFSIWLIRRLVRPLLGRIVAQAEQLQRSADELRLAARVFEHAQEAIAVTDADMIVVRVNPAFVSLLGSESRNLVGQPLMSLIDDPDDNGDSAARGSRQLEGGAIWKREVRLHPDGQAVRFAQHTVSPVENAAGQVAQLIHVFTDISERVRSERRLQRLAHQDQLTGLPNRAALERYLEDCLAAGQGVDGRFAVMFIDLDRFKPVNDSYGHDVGDQVLKAVAERLQRCLREQDAIGRLGGDEFLLITDRVRGKDDCDVIARKLIAELSRPFSVEGHEISIGASVGVALYPDHGDSVASLMQAADQAMYRVKEGGRGFHAHADEPSSQG